MAAIPRLAVELFQKLGGKTSRQAEAISAIDAAQRAVPPKWMDTTRGQRTIEALSRFEGEDVRFAEEPIKSRMAAFHGEGEPVTQSNFVNEDDIVELGMEFGGMDVRTLPPTGENIREFGLVEPVPSVKPYVEQGTMIEPPRDLPAETLLSPARDPDAAKMMNLEGMVRGAVPDNANFLEGLGISVRDNKVGTGFYNEGAWEFLRTSDKAATPARFTASAMVDNLPYILSQVGKKGRPTNRIAGDSAVVITVKEESPGFVRPIDAQGPESLRHAWPGDELSGQQVPIVLQTADGKPLTTAPRVILAPGKGGKSVWVPVSPKRGVFPDDASFKDVSDPRFWARQPKTQQEVEDAVTAMLTPEGQAFGASISREFWKKEFDNPDVFYAMRQKFFQDPNYVKRRGSVSRSYTHSGDTTDVGTRDDANIWTGFQQAAQEQVFDRKEVVSMYRRILTDPVVAERIRYFGQDAIYKLKHIGITDPDLADMPLIFYHTDQEFFHPAHTGEFVDISQMAGTTAELGNHYGIFKRAADEFLPLDTADADALLEYYRQKEGAVKTKMKGAVSTVAKKAPSIGMEQFFKYVEEIIRAPYARNADPRLPPARVAATMRESAADVARRIVRGYNIVGDKAQAMTEIENAFVDIVDAYADAFRNSSQMAVIFRGKKPLIMVDLGGFDPKRVAGQMASMPEFSRYKNELRGMANNEFLTKEVWNTLVTEPAEKATPGMETWKKATRRLQEIIEKEGYDHILYSNGLEAPGLPSIITWKQNHQKFTWASLFDRRSDYMLRGIGAAAPIGLVEADKENNNGN